MKTILTFAIIAMAAYSTFTQTQNQTDMKTIVLVHGAWADVSAWDRVTPLLEATGNEVIGVNLPGHGKDNTPYDKLSMQGYVDAVRNAIGSKTNIILVGHSMAGMIINLVSEQIPSQISKLIYVTAYVPLDGESLSSLGNQDQESLIGKYLKFNEKTGTGSFAGDRFIELFAADAPQEITDYLAANIKDEAMSPFQTTAVLTENHFGKISKVYVYAVDDKAIGYKLQKQMVKKAGITVTYSLNSSHAPFASMPNELSEIIIKEAK